MKNQTMEKQQLEDELTDVEISIDFYVKKIEQAEADKDMPFRAAQIGTFKGMCKALKKRRKKLKRRIRRMKNHE